MSKFVDGQKMRSLATSIQNQIPNVGFALFVFDFHTPGIANYISNASREDMIIALEEKVKRFKNMEDFPTPEHN